jgi:hypothetical protein
MRVQTYRTHYVPDAGLLMILADDFVVIVRMSDGRCRRFTYEELGCP